MIPVSHTDPPSTQANSAAQPIRPLSPEPNLSPSSSIPFHGTLQGVVVRGFFLKETIGEGTYGKVKIADHPVTMERIAVKIMGKETLELSNDGKQYVPVSTIKRMQKELDIHKALNHPNIIRLYDHHENKNFVFLLMELASGGELFDKIVPDVGLDDELSHFYFRQLVNAAVYLHGRGVCHRDFKPENMLLDEQGNLKISDFGLATVYKHKNKRRVLTTPCGSPPYLAPEVAQCKYDGELADVWSMGVILYVLMNGCCLWDEPTANSFEFRHFVSAHYNGDAELGEPWSSMDSGAKQLILSMLHVPSRRIRLSKVALDPWTVRPNRLYGVDGKCCCVDELMQKLRSRLRSAGEECAEDENAYISFSQPEEETRFEAGFNIYEPIGWFSQPAVLSCQLASQKVHVPASQQGLGTQFSPSTRLTRFYTKYPLDQVYSNLCGVLQKLIVKHTTVQSNETGCHICFNTVDGRRCPLLGDIRVQPIGSPSSKLIWLVLLTRRKGDPLEFKRFYRMLMAQADVNVLVLSLNSTGHASQHDSALC